MRGQLALLSCLHLAVVIIWDESYCCRLQISCCFQSTQKLFNLLGTVTSIHHTLHTKIIHQHSFSHFHLHISYNRRKSNSQFPDRLKCAKLQLAKIYVCRVVQLALYWNSWSNIWIHSCGHLPTCFQSMCYKGIFYFKDGLYFKNATVYDLRPSLACIPWNESQA